MKKSQMSKKFACKKVETYKYITIRISQKDPSNNNDANTWYLLQLISSSTYKSTVNPNDNLKFQT